MVIVLFVFSFWFVHHFLSPSILLLSSFCPPSCFPSSSYSSFRVLFIAAYLDPRRRAKVDARRSAEARRDREAAMEARRAELLKVMVPQLA